jgi:hypothetical protein
MYRALRECFAYPERDLNGGARRHALTGLNTGDKKDKGPQVFGLRAFMIGAQERTRTSTPLSAST